MTEELLSRVKTAIDFLKNGLPFQVGDLYLGIDEKCYLNVTAASKHTSIKYINKIWTSPVLLDDFQVPIAKSKRNGNER